MFGIIIVFLDYETVLHVIILGPKSTPRTGADPMLTGADPFGKPLTMDKPCVHARAPLSDLVWLAYP